MLFRLQAASAAADEVRKHPNRVSLTDLVKLYEFASALGRRACGMPLESGEPELNPEPPALAPDVEAALIKVYGPGPDDDASATGASCA